MDRLLQPPDRPALGQFTEATLEQFLVYFKDLWVYTAWATDREIRALCLEKGPMAALDFIEKTVAEQTVMHPHFLGGRTVGPDALGEFDFAGWFRAMQLIKLVPSVAEQSGSWDVLQRALELVGRLLQCHDPILANLAASTLGDDPNRSRPQFQPCFNGPQSPRGVAFLLNSECVNYETSKDFSDARPALGRLQRSLLPFLQKEKAWGDNLARVIPNIKDFVARQAALESISQLPYCDRYADLYLEIAASRGEYEPSRERALELYAKFRTPTEVLDAFKGQTVSTAPPEVRAFFLSRLSSYYPSEKSFADLTATLSNSSGESMPIRSAAALSLLDYYSGAMHWPEYRASLDACLLDAGKSPTSNHFFEISEKVMTLDLKEFIPVYEELVRHYQSLNPKPAGADDRVEFARDCITELKSEEGEYHGKQE